MRLPKPNVPVDYRFYLMCAAVFAIIGIFSQQEPLWFSATVIAYCAASVHKHLDSVHKHLDTIEGI